MCEYLAMNTSKCYLVLLFFIIFAIYYLKCIVGDSIAYYNLLFNTEKSYTCIIFNS